MAIITDPDLLSRYDVIFGSASQTVSIYPVGDTQRNSSVTYTDVFVASSGTITTAADNFNGDGVIVGDVVAIENTSNAGHYYVNTESGATLTLTDIDDGTGGAATTSLTSNQKTFDGASDVDDTTEEITLTAHGYVTGDAVVYRDGGGTTIGGLTDNGVHYVIRVDANTIQLATTFANAEAGTNINLTDGVGAAHTLDDRLLVGIFNNGASTSEQLNGNDTSGDGDGDVADGVTLQATYSFGKEEWRVDSLITDLTGDYNDDLIRHEFPYEAITSEQFEIGGGTSHDNWTWFNAYTRKKVRTAGWADKTSTSANDLFRETGIITLGALDSDSQVYYQQTSTVTPKVDFTFLGPVNEAIRIYRDDNQDGTPDDNFTTFLKLFVRKKGRTYAGSEIADIGVTTIQTIVNRFPLTHTVDAAITISDAELDGSLPYKFSSAPANIATTGTQDDGAKTINLAIFTSAGAGFQADGVVPGDILEITSGTEQGFYEILSVDSATQLTIKEFETVSGNDFTFSTGWAATESSLTYAVYSSVLTPAPGQAGVRDGGTLTDVVADTGIIETGTAGVGTITDTTGTFVTDGIAAGDILLISESWEMAFNASTDVDNTTADTITFANHNLRTGDRVVYDINGGTTITELVDGRVYYASVESANRFYVCATVDDAWSRLYGDSTEITLTPGSSETHIFRAHEKDGAYTVLDSNTTGASDPTATVLYVDTTDNAFPTTVKPNTSYRIVEPGMYLQFKDKIVDQFNDTQTTTPLTDLDFSGANTITITGPDFDYDDDTGSNVQIQEGDMIVISGSTNNDGRYTVDSRTSATEIVIKEGGLTNDLNDQAGVTISVRKGFERTIGSGDFSYNWRVSGNAGTLADVFRYIQQELRSDGDIDSGAGTFVPSGNSGLVGFIGNINDLLMSFATPTGTGLNLFIDNLDSGDINNATFQDHAGTNRNFPFTSSGTLVFSSNLTDDTDSRYWLFFTNDDAGDNLARDFGTQNAITVEDASTPAVTIEGTVNGAGNHTGVAGTVDSANNTIIPFTYDYDGNVQRGSASAAVDAPVTLVAIGLNTAQYVLAAGTITRATGLTISAVAALERNYST